MEEYPLWNSLQQVYRQIRLRLVRFHVTSRYSGMQLQRKLGYTWM